MNNFQNKNLELKKKLKKNKCVAYTIICEFKRNQYNIAYSALFIADKFIISMYLLL